MVYFGRYGKKHLYKFGTTQRKNVNKRRAEIRKYAQDNSFDFITVMDDNTSNEEDLLIEAYIRLQFARAGHDIIGNDHLRGNKNLIDMFHQFYDEALAIVRA